MGRPFLFCALLLAGACGNSIDSKEGPADAAPNEPTIDATPGLFPDARPTATLPASECPPGQFGIGLNTSMQLECAPITALAKETINSDCVAYLGARDSCDGCDDPPSKWGKVNGATCENGTGANNTCTEPTLGQAAVKLFGLNTDGDVNGDDKFYVGLRCAQTDDEPIAGPCDAGSFLSALSASESSCSLGKAAVSRYIHDQCNVYLGWRDECSGCNLTPAKWGHARSVGCTSGLGANGTCTNTSIDGGNLNLFGLNTDGDVDGNDMFYLGFHCQAALAASEEVDFECPEGQLVKAVLPSGRIQCESPAPATQSVVQSSCNMYLGFRDSCDGCTADPAKWGRVNSIECEIGAGQDNVCGTATLGTQMVPLIGINTDGDVNGDDKFYLGMQCP